MCACVMCVCACVNDVRVYLIDIVRVYETCKVSVYVVAAGAMCPPHVHLHLVGYIIMYPHHQGHCLAFVMLWYEYMNTWNIANMLIGR